MPKPSITPASPIAVNRTLGDTPVKQLEIDVDGQKVRGKVWLLDDDGDLIKQVDTPWFDITTLSNGAQNSYGTRVEGIEGTLLTLCLDNGTLSIGDDVITGTVS